MATTQLYSHSSEPRAVNQSRPKFREYDQDDTLFDGTNIMFDRRVVRGNTYSAQILPSEPLIDEIAQPKIKKNKNRKSPGTPDPVEGRKHMDIQTDSLLEELTDIVPQSETTTQTDLFMDRPPTPLFIPTKSGIDVETQIEDGDLFNFDFEVDPILEVLVGKTLEQGLMEVMEEEELASLRAHQEHFEEIRNSELVATQRMEAAEKRKMEEKNKRFAQEKARAERENVVKEKIAASTFARSYLDGIMGTVFDNLRSEGYFYDPVEKDVQDNFLPWLYSSVNENIAKQDVAEEVSKRLITSALKLKLENTVS